MISFEYRCKSKRREDKTKGADLVVDCLIKQGVTHVFGIPGAKIDSVFDVLQERDQS